MRRSWSVMPARALQDKKSRLAIQLVRSLNSWLSQVARPSRQLINSVLEKLTLRIPNTHKYKYSSYSRNIESFQREYWERNSSNSFTLTLSIVISLRDSLPKPFFTIPTYVRSPFGAWEAVRKRPISYWLILWFIAESGKLKKK